MEHIKYIYAILFYSNQSNNVENVSVNYIYYDAAKYCFIMDVSHKDWIIAN